MSQNTMEDYLAEGNAYRSDRKVIHKEATIKMLRVLSGDKNVDDTEDTLQKLKNKLNISEMEAEEQMKLYW